MARARSPAGLGTLRPTCEACNAFEADPEPTNGVLWGRCLEGPGTPVLDEDGDVRTLLPEKPAHAWCRRFQPKQ